MIRAISRTIGVRPVPRYFSVIRNEIEPESEEFKLRAKAMQGLVDDLKTKIALISLGGGKVARERHLSRKV